jgi:hypothetical protein
MQYRMAVVRRAMWRDFEKTNYTLLGFLTGFGDVLANPSVGTLSSAV